MREEMNFFRNEIERLEARIKELEVKPEPIPPKELVSADVLGEMYIGDVLEAVFYESGDRGVIQMPRCGVNVLRQVLKRLVKVARGEEKYS